MSEKIWSLEKVVLYLQSILNQMNRRNIITINKTTGNMWIERATAIVGKDCPRGVSASVLIDL